MGPDDRRPPGPPGRQDDAATMRFPLRHPRRVLRSPHLKDDAVAGLVLGVESVPDGLASGLLAGVNPVSGLYGYLFGMVGGALFTSTTFMAIQATGAMSILIADVGLGDREDPARSLFTLSMLTGAVMIVAGLLRLGTLLRFVSNSVITGFVSAVGINIILGQVSNFTGYEASGSGRIMRTLDTLIHPGRLDGPTVAVGALTIALIVVLTRTRLRSLGLVVAVIVASAVAAVLAAFDHDAALVADVADIPKSLPLPRLPLLGEIPSLLLPAASLALVGLIQGAGISAGIANPDGQASDASQDFVGQGAGNVVSGVFQGMPVGGSMSASSLLVTAGARSRTALFVAGAVMTLVVLLFSDAVSKVAMPSLAGLLMYVGWSTLKLDKIRAVAATGLVPATVMTITLVMTLIMPLQYAVLAGVGISVLLAVVGQSTHLVARRVLLRDDGRLVEVRPPEVLGRGEVVVIQPYGPVFFATAHGLLDQMPEVGDETRHSVVILRLRGAGDPGTTLLQLLDGYARGLAGADSRLIVVTDNRRLATQIEARPGGTPVTVYRGTAIVGAELRAAYDDARSWCAEQEGSRP